VKLRAAAIALLAGAALLLSGCGLVTPIATQIPYAPSDGVQGKVGAVTIINAMAIADAAGENANLLFVVRNPGEAVTLELQVHSGSVVTAVAVPLEADSITNVGFGESGFLTLTDLDLIPGDFLPVFFQYGTEQGIELTLPVLDGTLSYYAEFVPQAVAPLPTVVPVETPTPEPTETAAAH